MKKSNHQIHYLDLTICLLPDDIDDGLLVPSFAIYRKPTYTGISINQRSLHPASHKHAIIYAAINRLLALPISYSESREEIAIIQSIANPNGLQVNVYTLVKKLILRCSLRSSRSQPGFNAFATSHYCPPPWLQAPFLLAPLPPPPLLLPPPPTGG